jgi:hypothetical protein
VQTNPTKPKGSQEQDQRQRSEHNSLVRRYGQIGIPALAAALRYATSVSSPTHTPTANRRDERFWELAA